MTRDRALERSLLDTAATIAPVSGPAWPIRVIDRVDRFGHEHGDRWATTPTRQLLHELGEEALDLGGWSVLALQRASTDPDVPADVLVELGDLLQQIAALGAHADHLVHRATAIARHRTAATINP